MKLIIDLYLLPSLRVHLHFPMWHNWHGNNHKNSCTFAVFEAFFIVLSSLMVSVLHIYIVHTLFCVLHLLLFGLTIFAFEAAPYSVYLHKWPSSVKIHCLYCLFTSLSNSPLVQGSCFFSIVGFEAVEGMSCPCVTCLYCCMY